MGTRARISRRDILGLAVFAIGGLIGLGYLIPAIAYIISPARQKSDLEDWIRLGAASKVEMGTPTLFKANIERQTGWIINKGEISVYVITEDGRDFVAMSNICTHLGCRVRWIDDQDSFFCPCHNAVFDKEGQVVSGPPPRPLDRFDTKVENDQLYFLLGS